MATKDRLRVLIVPASTLEGHDGQSVTENVVQATHSESIAEVVDDGVEDGPDAVVLDLRLRPRVHMVSIVVAGRPDRSIAVLAISEHVSEAAYWVDLTEDGSAVLTFGNGARGRRPPTGATDVVAAYRVGSGASGDAPPGAITILAERSPGLSEVTNPLPAQGGGEPEKISEARRRAPRSVSVLDRRVSHSDFEAVIAPFAGVGRAAVKPGKGRKRKRKRRVVKITISADED